jgi:predicted DNA binding protein
MLEAVLHVRVPENWMSAVSKGSGARVRILDRKPYGEHGLQDLVEISLEGADQRDVISTIEANPLVEEVAIHSSEGGKLLAVVSTLECLACRTLENSNCFLISAETASEGVLQWTLFVTDREALKGLIEDLEGYGCQVELDRLRRVKRSELLTERQTEIIRIAYQWGYFDYPRRTTVRSIAKALGISASTLSETLRKGQKKVIEAYFKERSPH